MKNTPRFLLFVLTLSVILLSACSGMPSPSTGEDSNANGSSATPVVVDDNGNDANSNEANSNDANSNDTKSNDTNSNDGNSNDSGVEIFGVVEAITEDTITINGVTYLIASFTEFKDLVAVGDQVKIHIIFNADGTFTIREIEISAGDNNGNDNNSNDSNSNDANSNDDNGNNANSNDDNGNTSNSNDDNGGGTNSNDDNGKNATTYGDNGKSRPNTRS